MDDAELLRRVESFEQWHYEIELRPGITTPIFDPAHAVRHRERQKYFFDPTVALLGGLAGKRVLDLGSNAGFWSLQAIRAGADFVFGLEGRPELVEQAELVFEAQGIDRSKYRFEEGNVFEADPGGEFDVVLCLGLLYHVNRPFELFRRMAEWNSDVLIVDTQLSPRGGSALELIREVTDNPRHSVDYELVMFPTRQAVVDLAREVGYADVAVLKPRFDSWVGGNDFRIGTRRAFVCTKRTSIAGLDHEARPDVRQRLNRIQRISRLAARSLRRRLPRS